MKKTLVALAVAMTAASASATTIYEQEGTKVQLGGRVDVQTCVITNLVLMFMLSIKLATA